MVESTHVLLDRWTRNFADQHNISSMAAAIEQTVLFDGLKGLTRGELRNVVDELIQTDRKSVEIWFNEIYCTLLPEDRENYMRFAAIVRRKLQ